jgi:hypothetical protein
VLQPDNPDTFDAFLKKSAAEINVNIRYSSGTGVGGEWVIVPQSRREDLAVRFGVPPLLESWLLAEDDVDRERVRLAKKMFFSSIAVFHHGNRLTQLRYRKVSRRPRTADEVFAEPVPALRRELAEPSLAFKGRPERVDAVGDAAAAPRREEWTIEGLTELLRRLEQERPLQADVIRTAAQKRGRITRRQVYRLGGYDSNRSLRGFTRPSNRITRQLQQEGIVARGVDFPLRPVFDQSGQATHFVVPPELVRLLGDY